MQNRGYDPGSPFIQLLNAIGIDAVRLLAICKAASAKPTSMQLDYIQSRLAFRLEMKLRLQGERQHAQPLPHVSHFLWHFRKALSTVRERYEMGVGSDDVHAEIRKELAALYPDPQAGLHAFDTAIGTFLARVQAKAAAEQRELPEFLKVLKRFDDYSTRLRAQGLIAELEQFAARGKAGEHEQRLVFQQLADQITLTTPAARLAY